jgi:hypothetical protein
MDIFKTKCLKFKNKNMQEIKKLNVKVPQAYLDFMNQIFEIEKKISYLSEEKCYNIRLFIPQSTRRRLL